MSETLAESFGRLEDEEFRVLNAVERGMEHNEWVPEEEIPGLARLHPDEAEYHVSRLNDLELVERRDSRYLGYRLVAEGYDVLALNALAETGSVTRLGGNIEVGKESDIYECADADRELVMKLHREGYTQFRDTTRERDYTHDKGHLSWMYTARKAAEAEYETLEELYGDVAVPEPVDQNRHALVMSRFDGVELRRADVDAPRAVLDAVLDELSQAWRTGYVHADMSGYNVLVSPDGIRIIDWPQSVETDHPHARQLLDRDISNLLAHFEKRYDVSLPTKEDAVNRVVQ
ncbi:serine/threonine protein phosphatase [Haladaptatus sp. F3-133]|uniref:non-specific serine/threonine protein kinase n=1 Tax=Halorutilus salinus TaxID=2487751 RepID=A0A9Q4GGZ7_9EURY|nr:serine/threonine protein phosphatase [Halorutilus salinus]